MASPTVITPTAAAAVAAASKPFLLVKSKLTPNPTTTTTTAIAWPPTRRRDLIISLSTGFLLLSPVRHALAASDEEYAKETAEAIEKIRSTLTLDKNDPNIAAAVAELRDISNGWVAKYRKEKTLLSRSSFREMYSALNAVSGHYISFGPTAPIPAKRKQRILEEMDTAEKALSRGR
ncbi:Photosystem II 11 kDa protein precursor [Dorcoceras hygrometricum]|uniref:Photosystem II 11 kDa protein n=1 Tax=Dorcoceras hygrometricum TaxID=472368 RepID=A0A2Z7CC65_9LAMI|nr:Photosystem II 11 kDa protein precursor [Dorcoceras hygrometricum]